MKRVVHFVLRCVGALLFTGCSTQTLTQERSVKYAELDLTEFLSQRFQDNQSIAVGNSIRYVANFNLLNTRQALRPTTEIQRFCEAGGGKPTRVFVHDGPPTGRYFSTPRNQQWTGSFTAQSADSLTRKSEAAQRQLDYIERNNSSIAAEGPLSTYSVLVNEGTFGVWECSYADSSRPRWKVGILPVFYAAPTDPSSVAAIERIVIEIVPYEQAGRR